MKIFQSFNLNLYSKIYYILWERFYLHLPKKAPVRSGNVFIKINIISGTRSTIEVVTIKRFNSENLPLIKSIAIRK